MRGAASSGCGTMLCVKEQSVWAIDGFLLRSGNAKIARLFHSICYVLG